MKIISSYKVKIKHYSNIFKGTVAVYNKAVSFFVDVCEKEWGNMEALSGKVRNNFVESITISTNRHPNPKYDFGARFYKMPSYLRRAAIQEAIGAYSSYVGNRKNWEDGGRKGGAPKLNHARNTMPTLYKGNCYVRTGRTTAKIKIFHRNDWVWLEVELREKDVKYIERHCMLCKELVPTLHKSGRQWHLVFPFEEKAELSKKPAGEAVACAVDLGINNNATCAIVLSDGTVAARKFINLAAEKDRLHKSLNRVRKAQQNGSRKTPVKWKHVNDTNAEISRKTAGAIMGFALAHGADVVVFEHLDMRGKKRGSKKQRLALWRKKEIQRMVGHSAHRCGMRISRVCAWNTSRLAFDGSGPAERGKYVVGGEERFAQKRKAAFGHRVCLRKRRLCAKNMRKRGNNYSICVFPSGKVYHCDLNASYNIGARYHIREILKSDPAMGRLPGEAKALRYGTGTTRTLSTLIRLNADLAA